MLRSFSGADGSRVDAGLAEGTDGALYGVTFSGGAGYSSYPSMFGDGSLFKLGKDGSGFSVLRSFSQGDGVAPQAPLLLGSDGKFYGTTSAGGAYGHGNIFQLVKPGNTYTVLHDFSVAGSDGQNPLAELIEGADGALYGTTHDGGSSGLGAVYKMNKDGSGYTILYSFKSTGNDGQQPSCALFKASDGFLYGTTQAGGSAGQGTVFKIKPDGTGYAVLRSFTGASGDGSMPYAGVIEASNGSLYGVCMQGGASTFGTVFTLKKDGTSYSVLYSFAGSANVFFGGDGATPQGGLLEGSDGYLYGTTTLGGNFGYNDGTVFKLDKNGNGYSQMQYFGSSGNPTTRLIKASDGYLYGTLHGGGQSAGVGAVFKVSEDGNTYVSLYTFDVTAGDGPNGVTEGSDGALYGTAATGGTPNKGVVFSVNKDGTAFEVIHTFNGDGSAATGSLIEGSNGILYGVTGYGGAEDSGTVFQINKDGSGFAILKSFNIADGYNPGLMFEASDGMLYGYGYRVGNVNNGFLYRLNTNGSSFTVLKSFNYSDGSSPRNLFEGSDGILYGTMNSGGASGAGCVYKINKDGTGFSLLHSFTGTGGDGSSPNTLIEGTDGVLYGTTSFGNALNYGNVFKVGKDGTGYTILHYFAGYNSNNPIVYDGTNPTDLVDKGDGTLAGVTARGGSANTGVYFTMDKSGNNYTIPIGTHFIGATANSGAVKAGVDTFYAANPIGGQYTWGTIYQINASGSSSTVLKTFLGSEGSQPNSLVFGSDGAVYGLAQGVFRLSVSSTVNPPTLDPINSVSLSINASAQAVNLTGITDGGTGSQTVTVAAVSSNPGLIPNPSVTYNSPATTGSLHFTPANGVTGTATITVTLQDNGVGINFFKRQFTVSVVNPTALTTTFQSVAQIKSTGVSLNLAPLTDGTPYRVQFSTDLSHWVDLSSFTAYGNSFLFSDPGATNRTAGYYRLVSP